MNQKLEVLTAIKMSVVSLTPHKSYVACSVGKGEPIISRKTEISDSHGRECTDDNILAYGTV
jgi:hypothetical protein